MATPVRSVISSLVTVGFPTKKSEIDNVRADALLALTEMDNGNTASIPATPVVSQRYLDTDANVIFSCFTAGTFQGTASNKVKITDFGLQLLGAAKFEATSTGPHFFGAVGSAINYTQLTLVGSFLSGGGSTICNAMRIRTLLTMAPGDVDCRYFEVFPNITTSGATEVVTTAAGGWFSTPNITVASGDAITNAVNLYIAGAPTEGTNNYALWVDAGIARFDDNIIMQNTKRLFFDSGLSTYMYELADGQIRLVTNGTQRLSVEVSGVHVLEAPLSISPTEEFFLDGSVHTSIFESADDIIAFKTGGVQCLTITDNAGQPNLSMSESDYGTNGGPTLGTGRNSNSSTPAPGAIHFISSIAGPSGQDNVVYVDPSDDLRIIVDAVEVTSGTNGSGVVIGTQSSWHELKRSTRRVHEGFAEHAMMMINDITLNSYRFKKCGQRGNKLMHGLVVMDDQRKDWWVMNGGLGQTPVLDEANLFGHMLGGMQYLSTVGSMRDQKIESLQERIEALEKLVQLTQGEI